MITKKQLEKIGIFPENQKIFKGKYYCEITESFIYIDKSKDSIRSLFERIYEIGIESGVIIGKSKRSTEISRILNNEDLS